MNNNYNISSGMKNRRSIQENKRRQLMKPENFSRITVNVNKQWSVLFRNIQCSFYSILTTDKHCILRDCILEDMLPTSVWQRPGYYWYYVLSEISEISLTYTRHTDRQHCLYAVLCHRNSTSRYVRKIKLTSEIEGRKIGNVQKVPARVFQVPTTVLLIIGFSQSLTFSW